MTPASGLHENRDDLSADVLDRHRAIESLREELEAVDWYDQRVQATEDGELRAILEHNRDEEMEHAAMLVEWLRRRSPVFEAQLRTYLFTSAPVTEVEEGARGAPDLGIGDAKEEG